MNKDLVAIFEYLEREKGIKRDIVIAAIEDSLKVAAQKSIHGASNVTVRTNRKTGQIEVFSEKEIVEEIRSPALEISLEQAQALDPDCQLGQFIDIEVTPRDFGRIAAQKARQIISQKLREAERNVIYEEYRHRINELVVGTVERVLRGSNLIIDLGKVKALMPARLYPKNEVYQTGDKVLALLLAVRDTENGGAEVLLSRSDPEFVRQLLMKEVPEVEDGTVQIDRIVREAGYRTKLTVRSNDPKVDPVGACVGMRGNRVKNIVRELQNEKIDIIPYAADSVELLQNALAPIEIVKIRIDPDDHTLFIVVQDEDYPAVIGKRGFNARLNSQLIGCALDVQSMSAYNQGLALDRNELSQSGDPTLDQPFDSIPGLSSFILEHLIAEGYDTPRKLLTLSVRELAKVPGMSADLAEHTLEQVRKLRLQRVKVEDESSPADEIKDFMNHKELTSVEDDISPPSNDS